MKKSIKRLLFLSGLIAAPVVVNKLIFKKAGKRSGRLADEHFYEWRHCDVRYMTAGEGEPLLLVHGAEVGSGIHEWEACLGALSRHYKVYALDLAGFGGSGKPRLSYSAYFFITMINDFIDDVVRARVNIAAANTSAAFAVMAHSFRPDNFNRLLLVSPTGLGEEDGMPPAVSTLLRWIAESPVLGTSLYNIAASRLALTRRLRSTCYSEGFGVTDGLVDKYYYPAHRGDERAKYPFAALISGFLNVDIASKLGKLDIPVRVVWGTENKRNPIANYELIKRQNPEISLSEIKGARLLPHAEFPREFCRICTQFF